MAGRGFPPKDVKSRRRRVPPAHDWRCAEGVGWRHGEVPRPPSRLTKAAGEAWTIWMGSWSAWFWGPEDVPALRQVVRLYDRVERGEFQRHGELRLAMDTYGITPKGQQDRRWRPPDDRGRRGGGGRGHRDAGPLGEPAGGRQQHLMTVRLWDLRAARVVQTLRRVMRVVWGVGD